MSKIAYTVRCRIEKEDKAQAWLDWLEGGHIADVIEGGAMDAAIIKLDDEDNSSGQVFEVRYHFENREAFDLYIKNHAPRLREEGLKRFPPEDGFEYSRTIGDVLSG